MRADQDNERVQIHMSDQVTFCSYPIRHDSFAPETMENYVHYYINGYEYFSDVYDAFERARVEIYITDWMFSPEMPLKRPLSMYPDSR